MPAQNSESAFLWLSKWRPALVRIAPPLWLIISIVAIAGLVGVKQLGGLQSLELRLFDWRVRLRPEAEPDDRLLVVAVTEADIAAQEQWPLPDALLARVLANLQQHEPAAIGLDLYRDLPVGSGGGELAEQFQAPNLVAITKIGNPENPGIPPPPQLPPAQIGFNDLLLDPDGVVRRQLLFAEADGTTYFSLALRLGLLYLGDRGIQPKNSAENPEYMELRDRVFVPLNSRDGGYTTIDDRGYQILLNYRAVEAAPTVIPLKPMTFKSCRTK